MKILQVSSARTWRGGEQQIAYLLEGLIDEGHELFVFCPHTSPLAAMCAKQGWSYQTYTKRNLDPRVAWQLTALAKTQTVDLIHLHDSHSHSYGVMAARLFGLKVPMVLSRRVDFPISSNFFSRWKYNHPQVRKILCVSRFIRDLLKPDIRDHRRLEVVYSGVDTNNVNPHRTGILRRQYGIGADEILIGNIAAIAPHKDYYTWVDSVKVLLSRKLKARFLIIGDYDDGKDQLLHYIQAQGLQDHIQCTGFRTDIRDIICDLDILLVSSQTEGLGTTIIDAFASEVPVVATNAGGIPELVRHRKTGWLGRVKDPESLANGVEAMIRDTELRNKVIREAQLLAPRFHFRKMVQRTVEVYERVVGDKVD